MPTLFFPSRGLLLSVLTLLVGQGGTAALAGAPAPSEVSGLPRIASSDSRITDAPIVCHVSQLSFTVGGDTVPADLTLAITQGTKTATLEGHYTDKAGKRFEAAELTRTSKVDASKIKVSDSPFPDMLSYPIAVDAATALLAQRDASTRGISSNKILLEGPQTIPGCAVLNGEQKCIDVPSIYGTYAEYRDAEGGRLAAAASLAGGWYSMNCD